MKAIEIIMSKEAFISLKKSSKGRRRFYDLVRERQIFELAAPNENKPMSDKAIQAYMHRPQWGVKIILAKKGGENILISLVECLIDALISVKTMKALIRLTYKREQPFLEATNQSINPILEDYGKER